MSAFWRGPLPGPAAGARCPGQGYGLVEPGCRVVTGGLLGADPNYMPRPRLARTLSGQKTVEGSVAQLSLDHVSLVMFCSPGAAILFLK